MGNRNSSWAYGLSFNNYYDGAWKAREADYTGYVAFLSNGDIQFGTGPSISAGASSSTEARLTITNAGNVLYGATSSWYGQPGVELHRNGGGVLALRRGTDRGNLVNMYNSDGNYAGQIETIGGNAIAFSSASDYRLKENIVRMTSGSITRLKQLLPSTFNYITDPDDEMEGFIAHEAQAVVPTSASGVKDGMETITNNEGVQVTQRRIQGMDNAKLVPLLTAALQEAVAKIEVLEVKVTVLEG
jgi:hypothetical protein